MTQMIRPFETPDLAQLHAINCAGEPGVGAVSEEALAAIISKGNCCVAENATGQIAGFLLTLGPEAGYASKNYQWFDERYEDYIYVDRIAIAPDARGGGFGTALYQHSFKQHAGTALVIGCEVNTAPPNPGSMRFHERVGFHQVGEQAFSADYAVAYLARRLTS